MSKQLTFQIKSAEPASGEWAAVFEAYASTKDRDRGNEIVEPNAFEKSMPAYMRKNPMMLFNHNPDYPVGQILEYRIDDIGLWVKGGIHGLTQIARDVAALVKSGIVRTMSFMFKPLEGDWDKDERVYRWKDLEVLEIGPVSIPMNPEAIIEQAKSKGIKLDQNTINVLFPKGGGIAEKGVQFMDPKDVQKEVDTSLAPVKGEMSELKANVSDMKSEIGKLAGLQNQVKEMKDRDLPEQRQFIEKIAGDFKKAVDALIDAQKTSANKVVYGGRNGTNIGYKRALGLSDRRLKRYFSSDAFMDIDDFRRMNDAILLYDMYRRKVDESYGKNPNMADRLKSVKSDVVQGALDELQFVAKAIDTGTSGEGAEYLPVGYSARLADMVRLEQVISPLHFNFQMTNATQKVPVEGADVMATRATERTTVVSTKAETTEQTPGSANKTFSAEKFRGRFQWSSEADMDLIISLIDYIQKKLARGTVRAREYAIISGDDAAGTGYDTGDIPGSTDPRYCWNGYRYVLSYHAANAMVDMSTFGEVKFNHIMAKMGKYAKRPSDVFWLTGIKAYLLHCLNKDEMPSFRTLDHYGPQATVLTGELAKINGSPLFVHEFIEETYNASGIYDGTTKTKSLMLCVNKDAWWLGKYMAPSVEIVRDALYDVWDIVTYSREDFQCIYDPTSEIIVAGGYNISTSA